MSGNIDAVNNLPGNSRLTIYPGIQVDEYTSEQCSGMSWHLAPLWGRKYTIRLQPKCSEDLSVIHAKLFSHSTCFCPEIMRPLSGRE